MMELSRENLSWSRNLPAERRPKRLTLTLADGYETSVYYCPPRTDRPRRPVVYMHGIQSHPGWFVGSADALAGAGHPVFLVTRRGSGDNTVDRGHAASAGQLLDDVQAAVAMACQHASTEKVHMVGVSWGGKLLAAYAADTVRVKKITSLTLVAPGIAAQADVSPATKLTIGLALLVASRRLFNIPLNDAALFTDNPVMREYLEHDPLRLHKATAKFLFVSRLLDRQLKRKDVEDIRIPTTLILAGTDRIIDNAGTERRIRQLYGENLRVEKLQGAHTLEFEPDPVPLYHVLIDAIGCVE